MTVRLNNITKNGSHPLGAPQDFIISPKQEISLPATQHRISILEYFPHFSRDTKSKKNINLSERPVNPAIKVKVHGGEKAYEKWLFSKVPHYGQSGHPGSSESAELLQMVFTHIDQATNGKNYSIVAGARNEPVVLISEKGKTKTGKLDVGKKYNLGDDYYFIVEKISSNAVLEQRWGNNSETLKAPAIVLQVNNSGKQEEIILELSKPKHIKSDEEMIVLIFSQQQTERDKETKRQSDKETE